MNEHTALRVGVLFGGRSSEHEVSLNSARNVMDALRQAGHTVVPIGITREGRWLTSGDPLALLDDGAAPHTNGANGAAPAADGPEERWALLPRAAAADAEPLPPVDVIFPVLHGPFGEDGTVQGMLDLANVPYVGCGVLASAVCMDKVVAKRLFAAEGLPQADYRTILRTLWQRSREEVLDALEQELGYPLFVKPANLGSSVGITKARDRAQLAAALDTAARFDRKLLIEQAVPNAREIEVSVLGNETPAASVPGEIVPGAEFYDYAAKYLDDSSRLVIPAALEPEVAAAVREMAVRAFLATDCSGLARVDFLIDGETNAIYLNEINTLPGFTRISMYPKLWEASGMRYPELVDRLVRLAFERHADRQQNETARA